MTRILFVCHGNICRSPMAEMILKELVRRKGIASEFCIDSCATSREEICGGVGNPIYPPAREILQAKGIPIESHRARQLTFSDYEKNDLLIGMDSANIRNMHRMLGSDPEGKIFKLLSFAGDSGDVADPWYSDRFDKAYCDILRGCEGLLRHLTEKRGE